jgi:hypothetical protein
MKKKIEEKTQEKKIEKPKRPLTFPHSRLLTQPQKKKKKQRNRERVREDLESRSKPKTREKDD